ncbi:alpha/beta-hydrolase [Aspergillus steynii IBT 23096]|uniref:Alpha/beta-hydrolase n=1 Tax=Aspergillus steynii IBT 23096 TaxID=1392250 RepID=A0A2I2G488_9EURO|nr:alpha/beta-hydrolase [Aspergillus steynii IBT 23096]PLB47688.1 alpha/beta-hydrolase [Aspergillus steynii IBT 23096]
MGVSQSPIVVIAPGAWNRGSAYDDFGDILKKRGIRSMAVDHVSNGAEPPNKGLTEDSNRFRELVCHLVDQGEKLVLLGHSYGGMVISAAATGLGFQERQKAGKPGGVICLVYVAAFVAERGKNLRDMVGGQLWPWMLSQGDYVRLDSDVDLVQDVPAEIKASRTKHMLPHICLRSFTERATEEPWHTIPSAYIVCDDDVALPPTIQDSMIKSLNHPRVFRLNSGHSPFQSMPTETADILLEICKS